MSQLIFESYLKIVHFTDPLRIYIRKTLKESIIQKKVFGELK